MSEQRIHIFSNGTQAMDWFASNCEQCALAGDPSEAGSSHCELFEAIHDAGADDGSVTPEIARRMGYKASELYYVWACPERTKTVPWAVANERELKRLAAWNAGEPIKAVQP
jgi:hypothetical protein